MNYYARNNIFRYMVIIIILISLPLLFLICAFIIDNDILYITSLITGVIMLGIAIWYSFYVFSFRSRCMRIMKLGRKVPSDSIEIIEEYHKGNRRTDPPTRSRITYSLKVEYTYNGEKCEHITPYLKFAPKECDNISCNVYIYEDEVFATDFVNLEKVPTDWFGILMGTLFIIVLFGAVALWEFLKSLW